MSLIAGICLGFGLLYLFIGLRRKDSKPLNFTFALFALCYAANLLNGIRCMAPPPSTPMLLLLVRTRFSLPGLSSV